MSIVQLSVDRPTGSAERMALRRGVAGSRFGAALQLMQRQTAAATYCAGCSAPIDFGAVWRGVETFCSVECSLGDDRPA